MRAPQQENPQNALIQKLDPARFPRMSGVMAAIVGFVLDAAFIDPPIAEIHVTTDGFVLARTGDDAGVNHFLGRYSQLLWNWRRLLAVAQLTTGEYAEAMSLFAAKVGFFGQTIA